MKLGTTKCNVFCYTEANINTSDSCIIIKKGWQCKAGRERLTPYQSEDPNPTTLTHRMKKRKGKQQETKREQAARPMKRHWPCS